MYNLKLNVQKLSTFFKSSAKTSVTHQEKFGQLFTLSNMKLKVENWIRSYFKVIQIPNSQIAGSKDRFYIENYFRIPSICK